MFLKLVASQTIPERPEEIPELPEIDGEAIIACVRVGVEAIPDESHAFAVWVIETFNTVDRLIEQRRRCNDMTNDRLQQACMATWTASTLFEANRLRNDLARITSEENADLFRYHFLICFEVDPNQVAA